MWSRCNGLALEGRVSGGGTTMDTKFPAAVPEIPVKNMAAALTYYHERLGFEIDWRSDDDGIAGASRGHCRIFLTTARFRRQFQNEPSVVTWLNCESKAAVDAQHGEWHSKGVTILARPASKPWKIHEFAASDLDGNVFRVFYDYSRDG